MELKYIELYERNGLCFIKDQYRKDTYFEYEDAYNYSDIDKYYYLKKVTTNILLDIVI